MKMRSKLKNIFLSLCCALLCVVVGALVFVNNSFNAKAAEIVTTSTMYCDGASIRLHEDGKNGIRFHVRVKSDKDGNVTFDKKYSKEEFLNLTTGILVIPSNKLSAGEELMLNAKYASGAKAANVTGDECVWNLKNDGTNYFYEATAYVYNIPESSYDREFTFRGYCVTDSDTYYTVNTNNTRSVSYVALRAKIDDDKAKAAADENVGFQGEFLTQLESFLPVALTETHDKFVNQNKYLYRVGNENSVQLSSLMNVEFLNGLDVTKFGVKEDSIIAVDTVEGNVTCNISGAKAENTTLQFNGTGVVKISIVNPEDYTRKTTAATEMMFEVVNATNVTAYSQLKAGKASVLLNDITMSSGSALYYNNATLYGNGFTFDATQGAYTGVNYDYESYVIALIDSTLDNVKIIGAVYTELGATKSDSYNRALVLSSGNCRIINCYLSNCASPIRNGGDLELVNTTLKGGIFANLDFRAGHIILDNVTTINQASCNDKSADGKTIIGLGISTYTEGGEPGMSITIRNALTQYNYISSEEQDNFTDQYSSQIVKKMFSSDFAAYQSTINGTTWVNAGILSMNDYITADSIIDERADKQGYSGFAKTVAVGTVKRNCYLYSVKPTAIAYAPSYETVGQGAVAPNYSFDYTNKNYIAKTEGSNDYCYQADGVVYISMDEGDTFNWDTSILTVSKAGQTLSYSVAMNKTDYTGKKITFNASGDYEVVYTYTDNNNYNADASKYEITYTKIVKINVVTVKASAKQAVFSFGANGTAYTSKTVLIGDKTYVMPDVTATVSGKIGSKTVNGVTVYYPITEMYTSDGKTAHTGSWYACFPIFKNALKIVDYEEQGTGSAVTYDQTTVTTVAKIPSTLKAVDPKTAFLYSMNATNYPPPTDPTEVSGAVCYTCNRSGLTSSNTRTETNIAAEYTYTDNSGKVYYYYIGYHCAEQTKGSGGCVTPDTLVTLADGTQKEIQYVTYEDELIVWDFYKGEYTVMPSSIIMNHGYDNYTVLSLQFEDGTTVNTINGHGFFDKDENEFVIIDKNNVEQYIGHNFVKQDVNKTVKLVSYSISEQYTESWSILSSVHYNCVLEGMLTLTPAEVEDSPKYLMPFEMEEGFKYDEAKMQADIEKYGLFSYEDVAEYMTYEQFVGLGFANFKVAIEKGFITWDELLILIGYHIHN